VRLYLAQRGLGQLAGADLAGAHELSQFERRLRQEGGRIL
jgi:hypothetical protein